uniref:DEAD/DEAH box helicase n=1 Tax=Gorillibacterium massiliense TaxID=1280390 RepID=UPI000693A97A
MSTSLENFASLPLPERLVDKLRERKMIEPTQIQREAIPLAVEGKDLIAESQTGTGRTLAYLLPLMAKLDPEQKATQAVILVPTRELGMQIVKEAEWLAEGTKLLVQQLIGGAALSRQVEKLRLHPQLVVGTPGRIVELIKLRKLSMHHVKTIVVDEVDQVFDLGSQQEVEQILKGSLRDRQVLFFSATVTQGIREMAKRWMQSPAEVRVRPEQKTAETLEHLFFVCEQRAKIETLRKIVRSLNPRSAIVFVNETDDIAEVEQKIRYTGLSIAALYGEAGKQERAKVMDGFRRGKFQLLLATDVAARGLDLPGVSHVIQFDPPVDADHYVHRAGRTGRMGRSGTVLSLVTERERFIIDKFAKQLGIEIAEKAVYGGEVVDAAAARGRKAPAPAGGGARTGA